MSAEIRKIVTIVEETLIEGGRRGRCRRPGAPRRSR